VRIRHAKKSSLAKPARRRSNADGGQRLNESSVAIDGRLITDMAVTTVGQSKLANLAATNISQLRGGRVAMVATSRVTYGMFRMWEVLRGDIDYEVQLFREYEMALSWIVSHQIKV
jgi:hypothetical protein